MFFLHKLSSTLLLSQANANEKTTVKGTTMGDSQTGLMAI